MAGLTKKNLEILEYYVRTENRELYWNYLAQCDGNDGYGLLALGVVRNDSIPGATANEFAKSVARDQHSRTLTEREWESFGQILIQKDLAARAVLLRDGDSRQALNLPGRSVQKAHDDAFKDIGISANAWTPRELLEAARKSGGEAAAERVWSQMLDNQAFGLRRGMNTLADLWNYDDDRLASPAYSMRMAGARATAGEAFPHTDPDRIGARNFYYQHGRDGWTRVMDDADGPPVYSKVRDPALIRELDDARELRLERLDKRDDFHPDDPARHRGLLRSPWLLSDAPVSPEHEVAQAASMGGASPMRSPAMQRLLIDAEEGLRAACVRSGVPMDAAQLKHVSAQLAACAAQNPLVARIDDVQFSVATETAPASHRLFAVHRPFGTLEPTFHVNLETAQALQASPQSREQAVQRAETAIVARAVPQDEPARQQQARHVLAL